MPDLTVTGAFGGRHAFDASLAAGGSAAYERDSGRDRLMAQFERLASRLRDPVSGEIHGRYAAVRACPCCGRTGPFKALFRKHGLPVVACAACDMVFASPCLTELGERRLFDGATAWTEEHARFLTSPTYERHASLRHAYLLDVVERHAGFELGEHLDVGAGAGGLVRAATERGWASRGIDANPLAVAVAQARGLPVGCGWFPDGVPGGAGLALVTLLDVLEHVRDLAEFFAATRRRLEPGGLLLVQVPNVRSLALVLAGSAHHSNNGLIHVNYFSQRTLARVVESHGFEGVHAETILTEMSEILRHPSEAIDAALEGLRVPLEARSLSADALLDAGLGYKLVAVFRRADEPGASAA